MCIDNNFNLYFECLEILQNHKIRKNKSRANVSGIVGKDKWGYLGKLCESENYGKLIKRFTTTGQDGHRKPQDASNNFKYPKVYDILKKLIHEIDPNFDYDSITLNHNLKCLPHYDKNNKSPSLIIALGDFEDGELIVEGVKFDIRWKPLIFNGGLLKHWTNDFIGDRYTIVYYKI
jgi:hypothetical protein